jgi:nicotinamidase-related amidase
VRYLNQYRVESTARNAWELGFNLILVEDACSGNG